MTTALEYKIIRDTDQDAFVKKINECLTDTSAPQCRWELYGPSHFTTGFVQAMVKIQHTFGPYPGRVAAQGAIK